MSVNAGDVFKDVATPKQELLLALDALRAAGSGAILTPLTENGGAPSRRSAPAGAAADMFRLILQQQHDEQVRMLNQRLAELDRRTDEALRRADERLAEILRTANKAKDGRAVFQDDDGSIYDQYGNQVGTDDIDWETWDPSAWKWRDLLGAQKSIDTLTRIRDDVHKAQEDLGNNASDDRLSEIADLIAESDVTITGLRTSSVADQLKAPEHGIAGRSTSVAKLYDYLQPPADAGVAKIFGRAVVPPIAAEPDDPAGKPIVQYTPG